MVRVRLGRSLLEHWGGPPRVDVAAATLAEALFALDARVPGVRSRILDDQGRVRQHVLVFVNEESVREREPADVPLRAGDTVHVLPSVSGG